MPFQKNIFKFAHQETRDKKRLSEKKRALYIVNRNFQKKFQKGVDNRCGICYNIQALKVDLKIGVGTKILEEQTMSTFMAKAETIERRWFVIDAAGKPLGRTAVKAADILRGKHRPEFTPHTDCGEFVIIINADKAILTGNKLEQKYYHHHSGYIGGLKSVQYKTLMAKKPELAMELAVKGMLPHNSLGDKAFTRLHVYAGADHNQAAQKPIVID